MRLSMSANAGVAGAQFDQVEQGTAEDKSKRFLNLSYKLL